MNDASRRDDRTGPFVRHVRAAIALGQDHSAGYASLTGGASRAVSSSLVRGERLLLPVAAWFDWRARRYRAAGIPLLDDLFVQIVDGAQPPAPAAPPPQARRYVPSPDAIRARVHRSREAGGYESAAAELGAELHALGAAPCFDCLVRHLLASARRLCTLAPYQLVMVRAHGLPPADRLLKRLLGLHLAGLSPAARLDERALPFQLTGVPIICADMPPMPTDTEEPLTD